MSDVSRDAPSVEAPATPAPEPPDRRPRAVLADRNLATVGFFSASSHRISGPVKTITLASGGPDGKKHVVQIMAGGNLGLPTTADQDKLVALPRAATNWPGRPVKCTTAGILRTLGLHERSGKHYHDVRSWMDRLTSTTIISERGLRVAGRWQYQRERVHVFDRAVSAGQELPDGSVADENHLWLSEWLQEDLAAGYTLDVDLDWYLGLRLPLARTLALPLLAWLEASRERGRFERLWTGIAEVAGLSPYRHPSKIREKLAPALEELRHAGLFAEWNLEPTRAGDGLKLTFRHVRKVVPVAFTRQTATSAPPSTTKPAHPLLEDLVRRGVHRGPALRLLERVPAEQPVAQQVAWFDRLISSRSGRSIQDRPAFLYQLIRDGAAPKEAEPVASPLERPEPAPMHHYQSCTPIAATSRMRLLNTSRRSRPTSASAWSTSIWRPFSPRTRRSGGGPLTSRGQPRGSASPST